MGRNPTNDKSSSGTHGRRRRLTMIGLTVGCVTLAAAAAMRTFGDTEKAASVAAVPTTTAAPPATKPATTTAAVTSTVAATSTVGPSTSTAAPAPTVALAPTAPTTTPTTTTDAASATATPLAAPADPFDVSDLTQPVRWAVFNNGKVTLSGRIPTSAAADTIATKAAAVVGSANVLVNYTIDPTAPLVASGPLFVADTVLFSSASATIGPEFSALLDLGRTLLANNPKVTITVVGRADSQGDPGYNLRLSQQRAQAAVDYLADGLDDPARLTAVGVGSAQPLSDETTDAGRQLNRSVAFVIAGLLET